MASTKVDMAINSEVLARAKKDFAKRRGISDEKILLKHAEAVTWPDSSLGCPLPGRMYAQVVTPGYRLVLSDGTTDYEYHADNHRRVVFYQTINQSTTK